MLKTEAKWLSARLSQWPIDQGVVLNVGSSDSIFRTYSQPWIEEFVIRPARERGLRFINQDLIPGDGVDISGDLLSKQCQAELHRLEIYGIVCSNVLEHIVNRDAFSTVLSSLIPTCGRALITVPFRFPYHADPIDTYYRPDLYELLSLFPAFNMIRGEILSCGSIVNLVMDNPGRLLTKIIGSENEMRPNSVSLVDWIRYVVLPFKMTCIEIERPLDRQ